MKNTAPYFKIESFGAVDGPGIRLVVFLSGCPYKCIYCHNPESWIYDKKNVISVNEVIKQYKKNLVFYKNGGITISGGEPLMHKTFCLQLARKCYKEKISLAIDTSGATFVNSNLPFFKSIVKYFPLWIVDIKSINPKIHQSITRTTDELRELELLKFIDKNNNHSWIRQVCLNKYTDNKNDLINTGKFIKTLKNVDKFETIPFHQFAISKYEELKINYKLSKEKSTTKAKAKKCREYIMEGMKIKS
ncbi:MAG: pyruvate formate-lyase-activating protein [Mycoplasmoidaceae bacterium]|nr:MAG: pyruvate formate-lyase-activating protein [Mycoplasmoidaceae bacterium]